MSNVHTVSIATIVFDGAHYATTQVPCGSRTGSASFPFPIPNVPDLIGVDFYAQALIPDLESTGEISHTQGLWIPITR